MFLIFGISQGEKQLNFNQNVLCQCCGQFGYVTVWMRYSYFMLFFISLFKWDKHYYAKMSCCGNTCELSPELGHSVETGTVTFINPGDLHFNCHHTNRPPVRRCANCGYMTEEDFQFCPKCGKPF
ncbi:MAG TPA: zinc ribbon domain-containing protein [Oscillospiraceae bacterium]|nr:zinc ribbon domain-containing protein [Oscillospiraceae bacterium]HPF55562.1 zinc ribbon domain-containing protein [Clostridiales bacterium]HPK34651.1 zinc ribbon domain-containing protein [Oscillospiraceae bacterium]HPR74584.1 zinc ribbon domain-containing protein [Oscillospiraceae bacterium]